MKRTKKLLNVALALLVLMIFTSTTVTAGSIADDAVPYTYGETYTGYLTGSRNKKSFSFLVNGVSNVYFEITTKADVLSGMGLYKSTGETLMNLNDLEHQQNSVDNSNTYENTRILEPGQYYIQINTYGRRDTYYALFITCEDAITLTKPSITKISSPSAKKMKFELSEVENRTGYEVQYSTSSKFKNAKKVTCDTSKTISKLTKGKTYYVRARAFAIYGSGNKVYSPWSIVKMVTIKK